MVSITSRAGWNATAWRGGIHSVDMSERTHFLGHYWGAGSPRNKSGAALAREVESVHLNNGWFGIGYNFLIGQDGGVLEGRGWDLVGAHCPGKNRTGIGVFFAVGGDDEPTDAAKRSFKALLAEAERRAGHSLVTGVHGDYYATECAGRKVTPWIHAGMPLSGSGGTQNVPWTPPKVPAAGRGKVAVDGLLGPKTYAALQKRVGARPDGMWGPDTRRKLQDFLRVDVDGIIGRKSVRALQAWVGVTQDGVWGRKTTAALQRALNDNKKRPGAKSKNHRGNGRLSVDGSFGTRTVSALQAMIGARVDGIWGDESRRKLQEWLGVPADGIVGTRTVKALQKRVGATQDGVWGRATTRSVQQYLNRQS